MTERASSDRGMALIGVMVLLMILSVAISAMSVSGRTELTISRRHETGAQAQAAAEAGLNHAIALSLANLNRWEADGLPTTSAAVTASLLGPDGLTGTDESNADDGSLEALGLPRRPGRVPLAGPTGAQYDARLFDEDDPARGVTLDANEVAAIGEDTVATTDGNASIVIQATGYGADGASTTLEAIASPVGLPAIVSNGKLTVQGNVTIDGVNGSVHSNDELELVGNPSVWGDATATNNYSTSGDPFVGGQSGAGRPTLPVPPIAAIDYRPRADLILRSDGRLVTQSDVVICDASVVSTACEAAGYLWRFDGTDWQLNTNDVTGAGNHHTYYAETDVAVSGSPGSAASPLEITLIAEGSIDVTGSPTIEAHTPELLFVTDADLKIAGNLQQVGAEARTLVHEQLRISGNASLAGELLIEDASGAGSLVLENKFFGGNIRITNNDSLAPRVFAVRGWREVQ